MTAYLLPGLGADHRLFDGMRIPGCKTVHVQLPVPRRGESMASFAREVSKQIDSTEDFILIGVSLGGMIAREIATFMTPRMVILISSAQCRNEIPALYRLQGRWRINRLVPGWLVKYSAVVLQGIWENDSWKDRRYFRKMILAKPSVYYARTVNMIVNWDRKERDAGIVHIHGTGDRTLPFRLVQPRFVVKGGSHMMVFTRASEINNILERVLQTEI